MAPQHQDNWSDSDDDEGEDVVTAVQLGIPDGALESAADLRDAAVSRIGGYPVRPFVTRRTRTAVEIYLFCYSDFLGAGILDRA